LSYSSQNTDSNDDATIRAARSHRLDSAQALVHALTAAVDFNTLLSETPHALSTLNDSLPCADEPRLEHEKTRRRIIATELPINGIRPADLPNFSKFTQQQSKTERFLEGLRDMLHCGYKSHVGALLIDIGSPKYILQVLWCRDQSM
jgi:hypothetical protein